LALKTALFDPSEMLALDGIDQLKRMRATPNPFWNRPRLDITWSLPKRAGFLDAPQISVEPMRLATREELMLYHDPSYVETMELFGNTGVAFSARFGLDSEECPVFMEMDKYASYPVGAAIDAVLGVASGAFKNAISFFGGLHHAFESKAAGFCYYNDCVLAIKKYKEAYPGKKVLYLDTDVHHGDGVQSAFYNDPNVLTISTHEFSMGFFPGTGMAEEIGIGDGLGYSVNLPLPPLTDDVEYWKAFEEVVVPIWLAYKPDFVLWDVGADAHQKDPLADLMLTYDTYYRLSKTIRQLVDLSNGKLAVVGGGGYDPVATARIWTIVLSEISGAPLPSTLPSDWIRLSQDYGFEVLRGGWTDRPARMDDEHYPKVRRAVDEAISTVKRLVFPVHGLEP
jgi:acetoin utilization protein AcuC